jgi:putative transposase
MVSKGHKPSVRRQCALLTLVRSNLYYESKGESAENLRFMAIIDKQFWRPLGTARAKWPAT